MLYWPNGLTVARTWEWFPDTPSLPAGTTLGGVVQNVFHSGGPFWRLTADGLVMRGRDAILAGRQLQADLQNQVPIIIGACDVRQAPLQAGLLLDEPDSAGAPFADIPAAESSPIVAVLAEDAAVRATTIFIHLVSGYRALIGGEQFGIENPVWGPRMHGISQAVVPSDSPLVYQVKIRPGLREAATAGTALNFNRPRCTMRLEGMFEISQGILRTRLHQGRANFVELERPPEGWGPTG